MARLPYLSKEDLPEEYQSLLNHPSNLNRIFANSPACRRAHHSMATYIRFGSKLDPRLREIAILEVGYLTRAAYEWAHHIKLAQDFNISMDDIAKLMDFNEGKPVDFDHQTRTVIEAAREMTVDGAISTATFENLRAFLNNSLLIELVATIAHYNGVVRMLASLDLDLEENYRVYLEKFPLPPAPGH